MRADRDKTFEALVREAGKALAAAGWREDEAERLSYSRRFARGLDPPLGLAVELFFGPDEETGRDVLEGLVSVHCAPAQELLDALDSPATAVIERFLLPDELTIELSPALPVRETARSVTELIRAASADLTAESGTVDDFLKCVAVDPHREGEADQVTAAVLAAVGRVDDARAVVPRLDPGLAQRFTAWLDGDYVAPRPQPVEVPAPSWTGAAARVRARREALAAVERLGPDAGVDARRAVLAEQLSARGLEETPYWIERHAATERRAGAAGLTRLVRDAVRAFRAIGDTGDAPVATSGHGPWSKVTLAPGADAVLARAYDNATRIGDLATVGVRLRGSAVVLDGVEVGHLESGPGEWDDVAVRAQIGRLPSSPPYLMQLRLPGGGQVDAGLPGA